MQNKKYIMAIALIACLAVGFFAVGYQTATVIYIESNIGVSNGIDTPASSDKKTDVHARIRIYESGVLIMDEYHAGNVTDLGDNATLAKLFGDADYNLTTYDLNATFISIGNKGALSTSSTVLPAEWNRTAGTVEDEDQSTMNITCIFYPDDSGPYTADCIGLNFEGDAAANDLFACDEFTEVSGIDETFTINIEFSVTISHS